MTDTSTDTEADTATAHAQSMAERVDALAMSANILVALEARAETAMEGSLPLDAAVVLSDQLEARIDEARADIARQVQAMVIDGDLDTIRAYLGAAPAVEAALDRLAHLTMLREIDGGRRV